jgi:hypothetical protein
VDLASAPPGAKAAVAETGESCTTPCKLELPAGRHVINYTLPGYRAGVGIITVPKETRFLARLDPSSGTVMVNSSPSDAQIFVDGQEAPQKTPAILKLPAGNHKLEVKLAGYKDQVKEVEVRDGETAMLELKWVARSQ